MTVETSEFFHMSRAFFIVAALLIPAAASAQSELSLRTIEEDMPRSDARTKKDL